MRPSTFSTILLPTLATCHALESNLPAHMRIVLSDLFPRETGSTIESPSMQSPTPTPLTVRPEHIDLRQVPAAPVAPAAPAVPNNNVQLGVNPNAPAQPAAAPVAAPGNPAPPNQAPPINAQGSDSVTVMWLETWFGTTSRTWYPKTVTVNFAAVPDQGPPPGQGEIGLGTITGEIGHTRTIVVGAAPTRAIEWKGLVGAVGVGLMGAVV